MKAPNTIYVDDLAVINDCRTKVSVRPLPNFSEYIRKDTLISLIESRISEILGDAQPNPVLRMELQGIIDKIKEK